MRQYVPILFLLFLSACQSVEAEDSLEALSDILGKMSKYCKDAADGVSPPRDLPATKQEKPKIVKEETYFDKGKRLENQGQYELAVSMYSAYIESNPRSFPAFNNRGCCYYALGQFSKAIADCDRAIALRPDDANSYNNRGTSYICLGQYQKAIVDLNRSIALKPDCAMAYYNRGTAYGRLGQDRMAIVDFDRSIALNPDYEAAYCNRAVSYVALGEYKKAVEDLDRAIAIKPDVAKVHFFRGKALARLGKLDESLRDFDKAYANLAKDSSYYSARAIAYFKNGEKAKGDGDISKALELAGDNQAARDEALKVKEEFAGGSRSTQVAIRKPGAQENPAAVADNPIRDKWAVIIGISKFANPEYNLQFAAKDASDFRDYLVKSGNFKADHVLTLIDGQATRANIMRAFGSKWLPNLVEPGDMAVVYISTHGTPAAQDSGGRNYLVAYDTDANDLYASGVDMDELARRIKEIKTDRALIILDTCYSGGSIPGARGLVRVDSFDATKLECGRGHLIISASSPNERSWESTSVSNGVFTKHLIDSLKMNPNASVKQAFENCAKKVEWEVKLTRASTQTPQLGGDWQGSPLILSAPATEPRPMIPSMLAEFGMNAPASTSTPVVKAQAPTPTSTPVVKVQAPAPTSTPVVKAQAPAPTPAASPVYSGSALQSQQSKTSLDFDPYMADLQRRIKRAWFPPKGMESKFIRVHFKVHRDGLMTNLRIDNSSGFATADQAAIEAVQNASPFRHLPAGSPDTVDIDFTFDYNVFNNDDHGASRQF